MLSTMMTHRRMMYAGLLVLAIGICSLILVFLVGVGIGHRK